MTTTLAPPHAVHPDPPAAAPSPSRGAAVPRVTGVLVVREEALAPTRRLAEGRLPAVLDALALQTRPPERLVLVAAGGGDLLGRVRERVEAHEGLQSAVPQWSVVAGPEGVDLGNAVRLALEAPAGMRAAADNPGLSEKLAPDTAERPNNADMSEQLLSEQAEQSNNSDLSDDGEAARSEASAQTAPDPHTAADPHTDPTAPRADNSARDDLSADIPDSSPDNSSRAELSGEVDQLSGEVDQSSAGADGSGPEWLWLLDDASAPTPMALVRLVEAVRRSRSVGVAGPKVVQWDNPRLLVELGRQVTRSGRRIDAPEYGEADQGQYDTRTDVLAVGACGMLLSREVYDRLDGFDPAFAHGGADLDLGWRAQLAGYRVVVVPGAVVRRTRTKDELSTSPFAAKRTQRVAARRVALARCAPVAVPFLALWILVSSIVSALGLLLLKRPRHAWNELADIGALFRTRSGVAARWRFRKRQVVKRRHLTGLFVGAGAATSHTWDRVQEALTPDRSDRRPTTTGDAAEPGPVAEEAEALTGLPPSLPQRVFTHPGFLAVLVCAALSALTFRSALTGGVLDAQGPGLAGGELHPVATDASGLWHLFRDSWHGAGFGNTLDVSPSMGVLSGLTWLVQWAPYVSSGRTPAGVTVSWLVLAAMPLSALTAYLASRVATRARWGRGLVALAWGSSGVLTAAMTEGRVSVVVAHILLPLVVAGFAAALKRDGTWTATFATCLAAGIVGAFVPALLILFLVAAVLAVLFAPGVVRRLRALVLALVPVALLGPWVLQFVEEPRLLFSGPGLVDVGADQPTGWQFVLAQPDGTGELTTLLFAPVLLAAVIALARRSGGRARGVTLTALAAGAVAGLAVAFLSERVEVGQAIGADGTPTLATLWAGVGLELYVAAVLGILLVGWHGLAHALGERRWGWRRVVAGVLATALAAAVLAAGGLAAWAGQGSLALAVNALPAVAVEQANGPDANRLVVLTPSDDRLDYTLIGNEPGQLMRDVERRTDVTDPGLATVLGSIAGGGPLAAGAGDALADLGVGFVSLHAPADNPLGRTLDASSGLTRLGSSDDQTLWRVVARPSAVASDVPVPPARVRLDDAQGLPLQAVPVSGPHGAVSQDVSVGAAGRTVVFAEAPEWASHAVVTFAGQALQPVSTTGTPTYAIPSTAGRLEADLPPAHQRWFLAQLALLAAVVFLAVPFGSRRSRRMA